MTFPHILKFLERQRKAETIGNGYPFDRVIPSNVFQGQLARDVQQCLDEHAGAIEFGKEWFAAAQKLRAELDAKQVDATLTYSAKETP